MRVILAAIAKSDGTRKSITEAALSGEGITIPANQSVLRSGSSATRQLAAQANTRFWNPTPDAPAAPPADAAEESDVTAHQILKQHRQRIAPPRDDDTGGVPAPQINRLLLRNLSDSPTAARMPEIWRGRARQVRARVHRPQPPAPSTAPSCN
jgi:hypothetical protein